jgi:hypothetical protein
MRRFICKFRVVVAILVLQPLNFVWVFEKIVRKQMHNKVPFSCFNLQTFKIGNLFSFWVCKFHCLKFSFFVVMVLMFAVFKVFYVMYSTH